jgi:hypothetical protein
MAKTGCCSPLLDLGPDLVHDTNIHPVRMVGKAGLYDVLDSLLRHEIRSLDLNVIEASEHIWCELVCDTLVIRLAVHKLGLNVYTGDVLVVLPVKVRSVVQMGKEHLYVLVNLTDGLDLHFKLPSIIDNILVVKDMTLLDVQHVPQILLQGACMELLSSLCSHLLLIISMHWASPASGGHQLLAIPR